MSEPTSSASAPAFLATLVQQAEQLRASDIHVQMQGKTAQVSLRLDGLMAPATQVPEPLAERLVGRIKFLSKLKTYQESLPQDGRIDKAEVGARNDIRVATYPTVTGEKIVLRFFSETEQPRLNELGLPSEAVAELERFLRGQCGLLLLTGPAGSGKTTTIYSCLRELASAGGRHVITIEDPVEQIIPGLMQTEVNDARGLDFAKAARHLLRQDPQVLVIGEVRDDETANIVVRAALTGHLVVSTLHAGSCRGVVERLQMMCPDHYSVSAALELVVNQRLLRRVCDKCRGQRCEACAQTGYRGRVPVLEWVRFDEGKREQLRKQGTTTVQPKPSLADSARELVQSGITDALEFERIFTR